MLRVLIMAMCVATPVQAAAKNAYPQAISGVPAWANGGRDTLIGGEAEVHAPGAGPLCYAASWGDWGALSAKDAGGAFIADLIYGYDEMRDWAEAVCNG